MNSPSPKIEISLTTSEPEASIPGYAITRRMFCWFPLAMTASSAVANGNPLQEPKKVDSPVAQPDVLTWAEFLQQAEGFGGVRLAGEQVDPYVYRLASLAARVQGVPAARVFPFGTLHPPVYFGPSHKGAGLIIIEWKLAPGAVLPPHNHPNYSICTLGLEGEARMSNYEVMGAAPEFSSSKSFQVRKTNTQWMRPGVVNTLSPHRDNIHTFQAGKDGARGIDIGTLHGTDRGFSFLKLTEKPTDPTRDIFEACWIGTKP